MKEKILFSKIIGEKKNQESDTLIPIGLTHTHTHTHTAKKLKMLAADISEWWANECFILSILTFLYLPNSWKWAYTLL